MTFATGLVLGAGSSSRLGRPKQLLDYQDKPLLQAAVDNALAAAFDQVIVAIGGAAPEVRAAVNFGDADIAENLAFTSGCSSSIVAALALVDPEADGLVLLLGDQPGVTIDTINLVITYLSDQPLTVCRYQNGRGHPFGFRRDVFKDLADLHGDKAVWKLLESDMHSIGEIERPGLIPPDVDTWDDYQELMRNSRLEETSR